MDLKNIPSIPINTSVEIKLDRQSILLLAVAMGAVVAFGFLLSQITKK